MGSLIRLRGLVLPGFVMLVAAAIVGGCRASGDGARTGKSPADGQAAASGADNAAPGGAAAGAPLSGDVIARVDDSPITLEDMRHALATDAGEKHQLLLAETPEQYLIGFANRKARDRMLFLEASRRGIVPPRLERQMSLDRMFLLKFEYAAQLYREIRVPAADVEKKAPRRWERIRLRELVVEDEAKARDALRRVRAGENFEALVKEMSVGPAAHKDGLMDFIWFYPNNNFFDREQSEILFKLRDGEVSPVLKTKFGYGLYRLVARERLSETEKRIGLDSIARTEKEDLLAGKLGEIVRRHAVWSIDDRDKPKEFFAFFDGWYSKRIPAEEANRKVVGRIDDFEVRFEDLLYAEAQGPKRPANLGKMELFERHREMLRRIIESVALAKEAEKAGVQIGTFGRTELDAKKETATVQYFLGLRVREKADRSEDALKKFYRENAARYSPGQSAAVLQIFVKDKEKTKAAYDRLAQGEEFAAVAAGISEGSPLGSGPDPRRVNEKDLEAGVGKKIFALGIGEVSRPIAYDGGFLVVKVIEKKRTRADDFPNVRDRVRRDYESVQAGRILGDLVGEIKSKYRFAFNDKERARFVAELEKIKKGLKSEEKIQKGLHHGG